MTTYNQKHDRPAETKPGSTIFTQRVKWAKYFTHVVLCELAFKNQESICFQFLNFCISFIKMGVAY